MAPAAGRSAVTLGTMAQLQWVLYVEADRPDTARAIVAMLRGRGRRVRVVSGRPGWARIEYCRRADEWRNHAD